MYQKKLLEQNVNLTIEDEMQNYNPNDEINYLTQIFGILKDKMNNGIIVFSIDNYEQTENYRIIGKLQKVIDKPIENFLILLNKIDKSSNKESDLEQLCCKIMEYFPNAIKFNFIKNTIVACCTWQINNELKMKKSFKHLIYYHYLNLLMYSKSTPTLKSSQINLLDKIKNLIISINDDDTKIKKLDFINKIKNVIEDNNLPIILKEIRDTINYIKENHKDSNINLGIREEEFNEEEVKKMLKKIEGNEEEEEEEEEEEKEKNEKKEEEIKINDQEGNAIILYYYYEFKNGKSLPSFSKDTQKIINYFTMKNMNKNLKKETIIKNPIQDLTSVKLNNISQKIEAFYEEYKREDIKRHNLNKLRKCINSSIGILKASKLLYIPLLGVSNAGKSTILNDLIGCKLLPVHQNECTKKGILIRYWNNDYPIMRKTKFKKDPYENYYYFESNEEIIANSIETIHEVLKGTNGKYVTKEENFFYEINIKIKFVEENFSLNNDLKEKICFIDLPGFGTNNLFEEKNTYRHLMRACHIFLFIVFNLKLKEEINKKMLDNFYQEISDYRFMTTEKFIKKCLFIINCDNSQDQSDKSLKEAKNDIINIITDLNENNMKDLQVSFFNAKFYEKYLFKLKYYESIPFLFEYEYNEFTNIKESIYKGFLARIKGKTFSEHLIKQLEENIKEDINKNYDKKKVKPNIEIENSFKKEIESNNNYKFKKGEITKAIKLISFGNENIRNSDLLFKSNIYKLKEDLKFSIVRAYKTKTEEIKENLALCFKLLDDCFGVDPNVKYGNFSSAPIVHIINPQADINITQFTKDIEFYLSSINKEFEKYNIISILEDYKNRQIIGQLLGQKMNIKQNLENKKWKEIQNDLEMLFVEETQNLKNNLLQILNSLSENIKAHYDECNLIFSNYTKNHIKLNIKLFKEYFSINIGIDNNIEKTLNDISNNILTRSKKACDWENRDGFWNWVGTKIFSDDYLNKYIDFMIQLFIPKIQSFIDKSKELVEEYREMIINPIISTKDRVLEELEEMKEQEKLLVKQIQMKNEFEIRQWNEKKIEFENNKLRWANICKKYRILKDEIYEYILNNNN